MMGEEALIDVEFFGDAKGLPDFDRNVLMDFVNRFVGKYGGKSEIFDVSVYFKRFEANYFGKPLIFCNIAMNTDYGLVSTTSTAWGLRQSLRQGLKSALVEAQKLGESESYGRFAGVAEEAIA